MIKIIAETRKNILKNLKINDILLKQNLNSTIQYNNFCYLVSGLEIFLSSKTFVSFIEFYNNLSELNNLNELKLLEKKHSTLDLKKWFEILIEYILAKPDYSKVCAAIDKIADELKKAEFQIGDQDDLNVIFIFMQNSFLFNSVFSFYDLSGNLKFGPYYYNKEEKLFSPIAGLIVLINYCKNPLIEFLENSDIIGVCLKSGSAAGGHYSVFQKIKMNNQNIFLPKNNGIYHGQKIIYLLRKFS